MHYYQKNIGDYGRDTGHLSALEHGVYNLLIDWYYLNERPITMKEAVRVSRGNPDETQVVLSEFFKETSEGWIHSYADRIIAEYHAKAERNRANGAKGGRPPKSSQPIDSIEPKTQVVTSGMPEETLTHKPLTTNQDKSIPSSSAAPSDRVAERLATVTDEAIHAYNESSLPKSKGGNLPNVSAKVGREKRQGQIKRCLRVARQICEASTGEQKVTAEFWAAYFDLVAQDDFYAGRQRGGNGHENYVPDFELLTREATMLKIYDRMVES